MNWYLVGEAENATLLGGKIVCNKLIGEFSLFFGTFCLHSYHPMFVLFSVVHDEFHHRLLHSLFHRYDRRIQPPETPQMPHPVRINVTIVLGILIEMVCSGSGKCNKKNKHILIKSARTSRWRPTSFHTLRWTQRIYFKYGWIVPEYRKKSFIWCRKSRIEDRRCAFKNTRLFSSHKSQYYI